eukprot:4537768-Alexandrium_andersonii.AAC.2
MMLLVTPAPVDETFWAGSGVALRDRKFTFSKLSRAPQAEDCLDGQGAHPKGAPTSSEPPAWAEGPLRAPGRTPAHGAPPLDLRGRRPGLSPPTPAASAGIDSKKAEWQQQCCY